MAPLHDRELFGGFYVAAGVADGLLWGAALLGQVGGFVVAILTASSLRFMYQCASDSPVVPHWARCSRSTMALQP